jgi:hypothetical protein
LAILNGAGSISTEFRPREIDMEAMEQSLGRLGIQRELRETKIRSMMITSTQIDTPFQAEETTERVDSDATSWTVDVGINMTSSMMENGGSSVSSGEPEVTSTNTDESWIKRTRERSTNISLKPEADVGNEGAPPSRTTTTEYMRPRTDTILP